MSLRGSSNAESCRASEPSPAVGTVGAAVPATVTKRRLPAEWVRGMNNLIVDDDGFVWYAGNRAMHIGRLDPEMGDIEKYMMPTPDARDPHTLIFDQNGDIWFSVQGGSFVGKLGTRTGPSS